MKEIKGFENYSITIKGDKSNFAKLKQIQVLEIRKLYSTGNYTYDELSSKFCVGKNHIYRIITKKRWSHI